MKKLVVALTLIALPGMAQRPVPASAEMRQKLVDAVTTAQLESDGTPPFRLEASFETLNYKGKPDGSGTLTEEWLKPGTWRRTIAFAGLRWTQVSREGVSRSEGANPLDGSFMQDYAIKTLLHQGIPEQGLQKGTPTGAHVQIGDVSLTCVTLGRTEAEETGQPYDVPPTYCFSENPPILRTVQDQYGLSVLYSHFVRVGPRIAAQDISVINGQVQRATLHVTSIKAAPGLQESDFVLPTTPESRPDPARMTAEEIKTHILKQTTPAYPREAMRGGVLGRVTMVAVINEMGTVRRAEVINGPPVLAEECLSTIKQWQFKPYLQNGKPVEVVARIAVQFKADEQPRSEW